MAKETDSGKNRDNNLPKFLKPSTPDPLVGAQKNKPELEEAANRTRDQVIKELGLVFDE